jgi:hypothetical protein
MDPKYKVGDRVLVKGKIIEFDPASIFTYRAEISFENILITSDDIVSLQPIEKPEETCTWKRDPDDGGYYYDTECGEVSLGGTPSEMGWTYCPHCSRRIEVVE